MIINPTFEMPLRKFKGKDLIIWGNETALLEGDGRNGEDLSPLLSASCTVFRRLWMHADRCQSLKELPWPRH